MANVRQLFSRLRQAAASRAAFRSGYPRTERRRLAERRAPLRALYDHETRIRCAAQEVGFGTYELDCVSGLTYWSAELKGIAGLSHEEGALSPARMLELIHPGDRERVMTKLLAAQDPGGDGEFSDEYRLLRPDGSVAWVKNKGRTFFSSDGQTRRPLGATGVVMDITERKLLEAALILREKHFDEAVRGAAIGIWNWDLRTGDVALSDRCRQLLDFPPGEPIDQEHFLAALHPDDRERTTHALQQALEQHEEFNIEYRITSPDGSLHWIQAIGSALYDDKTHAAVTMSGIVIDITDRKHKEGKLLDSNVQLASRAEQDRAELGEAQDALESMNLELRQFVYIAAHDMQTPLRSISGFAQLLKQEYHGCELDTQAEIWLDQLVGAAQRMHALIHDLLTYSGVASLGRPFETTDMNRIFDEVVAYAEPAVRENNATITRDILPIVMGDPIQLATLLQNLVENGIKYRGSEPPQIHASARREGDAWVFSVQDNGIGIAEKHHEQIFDIFKRLHTQQAYAGTGIGLAICRRIVQRHGGQIWVDSKSGVGSNFQFSLPAAH